MSKTNQKKPKDKKLNLKASSDFVDKLNQASAVLDIPYSQIIRSAVDEKLSELAQTNPALKTALEEEPAAA